MFSFISFPFCSPLVRKSAHWVERLSSWVTCLEPILSATFSIHICSLSRSLREIWVINQRKDLQCYFFSSLEEQKHACELRYTTIPLNVFKLFHTFVWGTIIWTKKLQSWFKMFNAIIEKYLPRIFLKNSSLQGLPWTFHFERIA